MAGRHAGYASVITIGSDFVDGMLAAAAAAVTMPTFALPGTVVVGTKKIGFSGSLSLVAPTVSFKANPKNLIDVTFGCTGTLRITENGGSLIQVQLTLTSTISVAIDVKVTPSSLAVRLDVSAAEVSSVEIDVGYGPPLVSVYETAIQSSKALKALTTALRSIPESALTFTIPGAKGTLDLSMAGVDISLEISSIAVVPLDGVLDVAADVSPYTSGDSSKLVDLIKTGSPTPTYFTFNNFGGESGPDGGTWGAHTGYGTNLAATVNSSFLCAAVNGPVSAALAGTTISGVTIDSVSLTVGSVESVIGESSLPTAWYGCATLSINGSMSGIGFNFVASVTPILMTHPTTAWWDFDLVAWSFSSTTLTIIDVLTFGAFPLVPGLLPLVINATVYSLISNVVDQISLGSFATAGTQSVPGLKGWSVSYNVLGIVVWDPEIDLYVAAAVNSPPVGSPPPIFRLSAPSHGLRDKSPIPVTLNVADKSLLDPLLGLRITWAAVRQDTGKTVLSQDELLTSSALKIAIDRWTGDLIFNDSWSVACTVYRPADAVIPRHDYYTGSIAVGVTDVVDRHHPYVHWDHTAFFHDPAGPPPLKSHLLWNRSRNSRIHRTDIEIRCTVLNGAIERHPAVTLEYLDTLAAHGTLDNVASWRHGILCDYCFFGGPTKTKWKTPTLPTKPWE